MSTYDVTRREHSPHLEVWKVDGADNRIALYLDDEEDALALMDALAVAVHSDDGGPFWEFHKPCPEWVGIRLQQFGHRVAYWSMDWDIAISFANAILSEAEIAQRPLPPPRPGDALTFDQVEAAGLDGTLRSM